MTIILSMDHKLVLDEIWAVGQGEKVELDPGTAAILDERRAQVERFVTSRDLPAYGFNRGFGHNVDLAVNPDKLADLQRNLIVSHSVGVGDCVPPEIVRIAMLLRANSMARGHSGVRSKLVRHILDVLNAGITPLVPELGSVGASGDLAPLSHMALTLIGEGRALYHGRVMDAAQALEKGGLKPISLEMKEGLALNNGVQFMNAIGLYCCVKAISMLKAAAVNSALVTQVMLAPDTYFREDFQQVRPHAGSLAVARWISSLMAGSPIRQSHKDQKVDGQVQDPYNIRCAAQVLGSCHDLLDQARTVLLTEANSATDNPIMLPLTKEHGLNYDLEFDGQYVDIVSGGHFHGMPVAVQIFNILQSLAIMSNLAHQRTVRFVDPARNMGLGRDLKWPGLSREDQAISSGMMLLEYTSASLVNDIWGSVTPSHLYNISTNSGQEDHVSMGTGLAVRLLKTMDKAARVLGIELAYTYQAIAIRKELTAIPTQADVPDEILAQLEELKKQMNGKGKGVVFNARVVRQHPLTPEERKLSPVSEAVYKSITDKKLFPVVTEDRYMAEDIENLAQYILSGDMVHLVEDEVRLEW